MKYTFKDVPDEEGDGFVKYYIYGEYNNTSYLLVIDYNTSSPEEYWDVITKSVQLSKGVESFKYRKTRVFDGYDANRLIENEFKDRLVSLVIPVDLLTFRELTEEEFKEYKQYI